MVFNKLFWILFILIGISIALMMLSGAVYLDIILGLFAITMGIEMLAFEFSEKKPKDNQKLFEELEKRERRIIKKVLELENRLNEISRAFSSEVVRSGRVWQKDSRKYDL